jgi:hypothetical protein
MPICQELQEIYRCFNANLVKTGESNKKNQKISKSALCNRNCHFSELEYLDEKEPHEFSEMKPYQSRDACLPSNLSLPWLSIKQRRN